MEIGYRRLSRDEIPLLRQIDRSEVVEKIYYHRDGQLVLEDERHDISNEWFQTRNVEPNLLPRTLELFDNGGIVFGAFADGRFAGIAALDNHFFSKKRLNVDILFVSRQYRGLGMARHLMAMVRDEALKLGAKSLYVSATPSERTVHFYKGLGFKVAEKPEPELFEKEPKDIHMELDLSGSQ